MALEDAEAVALRLGVPDEINFCHNLSLSLTEVVEYSIIIHPEKASQQINKGIISFFPEMHKPF